jgi:hypothetical protein
MHSVRVRLLSSNYPWDRTHRSLACDLVFLKKLDKLTLENRAHRSTVLFVVGARTVRMIIQFAVVSVLHVLYLADLLSAAFSFSASDSFFGAAGAS